MLDVDNYSFITLNEDANKFISKYKLLTGKETTYEKAIEDKYIKKQKRIFATDEIKNKLLQPGNVFIFYLKK